MKKVTAKAALRKHFDAENKVDERAILFAMKMHTVAHTEYLKKRIDELEDWKVSAMDQFSRIQMQEVGQELNVGLGKDICESILPGIRALKDRVELRDREIGLYRNLISKAGHNDGWIRLKTMGDVPINNGIRCLVHEAGGTISIAKYSESSRKFWNDQGRALRPIDDVTHWKPIEFVGMPYDR